MSDLVDDWTVDDTETAGEILTMLGIGCDASKEPGSDWRRDKIAKLIRASISQQDAELERMRREVEEANAKIAKTRDLIAWAQSDLIAEARKAAFIEAAEIATATGTDAENDWPGETWIADRIATALRAKAEETDRG